METKSIDVAVCPFCGDTFDPDSHKYSEWGREYNMNCPSCDTRITVFESIEYQVCVAED